MKFINPKINIIHLKETDSTNTYAKNLAKDGYPEGTVVIADRQTMGRGRLGRSFYSPVGSGIYMSIILKPEGNIQDTLLITTAAAVAVSQAIEKITDKKTGIKWVNDVYVQKKKVCGILCEGCFKKDSPVLEYAILGIGINISKPDIPFPDDIKNIAGYLLENDDNNVKESITEEVIKNFFEYYKNISEKPHLDIYRKKNILLNKPVNIIRCDEITGEGVCMGIDDNFNILIQTGNEISEISSGEVSVKERI